MSAPFEAPAGLTDIQKCDLSSIWKLHSTHLLGGNNNTNIQQQQQQQQQQHREQDESTITSKSTSSTLNDNTGTKYYSDKELDLTCNRPKQKLSENHANILIGGKGCTISKPDKIGMYYFPNSCLLHSYAADSAFGYSNRKQKSIDEDMNAVRKRKIRNRKFCQSI
mmetsp:Transcript_22532/g.25656  ORF Transcript_22532/g.25656 Transcript_22532/m.25656 type:complete len:166 (-) Transcript_22532:62-559(-)